MKKAIGLLIGMTFSLYASENNIELTPEYLLGKWCHTHDDSQGKIEEENLNLEFKEGGVLMKQTSKYDSKLEPEGTWKIVDNKIFFQPVKILKGNSHDVTIISQDTFSYKFFVDVHLKRGVCEKLADSNEAFSAIFTKKDKGSFTSEYIEGKWCYIESLMSMKAIKSMKSSKDEKRVNKVNIDFEFKKNGDFSYQEYSRGPIKQKGKWTIENGNLKVPNIFALINLSTVVSEDKFQFGQSRGIMTMNNDVVRGECQKRR